MIGYTILVVDDEVDAVKKLKRMLSHRGFDVYTATNETEAINMINQNRYDVIVTDLYMENDNSGISVLQAAKQRDERTDVIIVTAFGKILTAFDSSRLGAFDYIEKDSDDVYKRICSKIDEALNIRVTSNTIIKSIEFSPEYYQAGMSILTYFGNIVSQRFPDAGIKIKIEQENLNVRMIIQTQEGKKHIIEKVLYEYGLVIQGKMAIEDFSHDQIEILDLRSQLRLAHVQLENQRELLRVKEDHFHERQKDDYLQKKSLEEEVRWLRSQVGNVLVHSENIIEKFKHIANSALQSMGERNRIIEDALRLLIQKIEMGITDADEKEIKETAVLIQKENSTVFEIIMYQIKELFLKGSIAGLSGNMLTKLVEECTCY